MIMLIYYNYAYFVIALWYNSITDEGADKLAVALEKNDTLQALDLEHNSITDDRRQTRVKVRVRSRVSWRQH